VCWHPFRPNRPHFGKRCGTGGYVAIGWDKLGDLSTQIGKDDFKTATRTRFEKVYPYAPNAVSRKIGGIRNFAERLRKGTWYSRRMALACSGAAE
jgi:hypothetical protein